MSKYNNMQSIPIYELSKEELSIATKEWAEGNTFLEKLLWTCYYKKVETSGCHAGKEPWISFYVNDARDKIKNMLRAIQKMNETIISVHPDGGNPYSGPKWREPLIGIFCRTIDKEKTNEFFDLLTKGLLYPEHKKMLENDFYTELLDLHDYFADKDSSLIFRAMHTKDHKYKFVAELVYRESAYEYMNDLFLESGLKEEPVPEDYPCKIWGIEDTSLERISAKMKQSIKHITNNFSLEPPSSEAELSGFNQIARLKNREFGNTPEGRQRFVNWLIMKREEHHNTARRMRAKYTNSMNESQSASKTRKDKDDEELSR